MAVRSVQRQTMTDALSRLLVRFRRRLIAARAMRLMGTTAAFLAAACLAGVLVERLSGAQLLARIISVAVVAAGLPFILRLRHMPTLAAAALEIDRQMSLRELLSSAVLAKGHDGLSDCVVLAARQKAGEVSVMQLKAGSPGTPMWIAALLIAGLLPLLYRSPAGASRETSDGVKGVETQAQRELPRTAASSGGRQQRLSQEGQTPGVSAIMVAAASDRQRSTDASRRATKSDTAGLSAGRGLAQGSVTTPPAPPTVVTPMASDPGKGTGFGSGMTRADSNGTGTGIGQVTSARVQPGAGNEPPTITPEHGTVNAESFPESYRDVLKAYFARAR